MNLVIEINGRSTKTVMVSEEGITIGRSWDNDVVIKDRYVDPVQLKLFSHEGKLIIEDLLSSNGTEIEGKQIKGKQQTYELGQRIILGDTSLKVFDATKEVEKTALRSVWFKLVKLFKPLPSLFLLVCITGVLTVISEWIYSIQVYSLADGLSTFFKTAVALISIAACFATFNKLLKGFSSIKEHLVLVCFISIISLLLVDFLSWVIRFNLQQPSSGELISIAMDGFIYALFAVAALSYIFQLKQINVWVLSLFVAGGFIYSDYADRFSLEDHEKWSESSSTEVFALPPAFVFKSPVDVDEHLNKTSGLFDLADKAK